MFLHLLLLFLSDRQEDRETWESETCFKDGLAGNEPKWRTDPVQTRTSKCAAVESRAKICSLRAANAAVPAGREGVGYVEGSVTEHAAVQCSLFDRDVSRKTWRKAVKKNDIRQSLTGEF